MATDNRELTKRLMEDVWNAGNLAAIDDLLDPDFQGRDPLMGTLSREAYRNAVKGYRRAFPDLKFERTLVLTDSQFVITHWTMQATHLGPFLGTPSTGKSAMVTGIDITELRNGKVRSDVREWDALSLLRQLGLEDVTVPMAVRRPREQQSRGP
jgi:steroid delta-isomerase-like uncharacterized protein